MSQYFDIGEKTLWNPSSGVSHLFQRQVEIFEAELKLSSGIEPMRNDECQIDPATFETFVNALLVHRRTSHTVLVALSEGFTATVLVLAERAGIRVDWTQLSATPEDAAERVQVSAAVGVRAPSVGRSWGAGLREKVQELGGKMPC
ncbi:DUF6086 family protein [Streptomyces sp. NPDC055025]